MLGTERSYEEELERAREAEWISDETNTGKSDQRTGGKERHWWTEWGVACQGGICSCLGKPENLRGSGENCRPYSSRFIA